jgi:hypothetical protein
MAAILSRVYETGSQRDDDGRSREDAFALYR